MIKNNDTKKEQWYYNNWGQEVVTPIHFVEIWNSFSKNLDW